MKLLAALATVLLVTSLASAEVLKGTTATFDDIIKNNGMVLVKFYAPWCGHCKKIAPEFEKASTMLEGGVLAEVDCTVEEGICSRFKVEGYPTLIVFRNGKEAEKYAGPRDAKGIANYLNSQVGPAMKTAASVAELKEIRDSSNTVCLVMTKSADTVLAAAVSRIAEDMRSKMTFVLVTDQSVSSSDAMESIVVYRGGKDEKEAYTGPVILSNIEKFLQLAPIPFFGEINPDTFSMYISQNEKPVGWLFLSKDTREDLKQTMVDVARKHRDTLFLCWVNADLYGGLGQQMGVPANPKYPAFVIGRNRVHYVQPTTSEVNEASISEFIEKYAKGEVLPTIRSEEIPAVETTNGLTTLVAKSIANYEGKKDLFVLFYAPWCGHCKTLLPEFEKLAKELESSDVVIAKMDATANDVDREKYEVQGFPTLYFIPAESAPIPYNGGRTFADLLAFVKEHSTIPKPDSEDHGDL